MSDGAPSTTRTPLKLGTAARARLAVMVQSAPNAASSASSAAVSTPPPPMLPARNATNPADAVDISMPLSGCCGGGGGCWSLEGTSLCYAEPPE